MLRAEAALCASLLDLSWRNSNHGVTEATEKNLCLLQREPVSKTADPDVKVSRLSDGFVIGANEREIIAAQLER